MADQTPAPREYQEWRDVRKRGVLLFRYDARYNRLQFKVAGELVVVTVEELVAAAASQQMRGRERRDTEIRLDG